MRRLGLLLPLLLLSGCQASGEGPLGTIVDELLRTRLHVLILESIKWMVLYGILGLLAGLAVYFLLKRLGAYRWEWGPAKWLRRLVAVLLFLGGGAAGTTIGAIEGVTDGFEAVLRESRMATDVFPVVGDAGADFVAVYYVEVPRLTEGRTFQLPQAELDQFRNGKWEIDAAKLAKLSAPDDETIDRIATELEREILAGSPKLQDTYAEQAIHEVLVLLGTGLAGRSSVGNTQLGYRKLAETLRTAIETLPEAATKGEGDPKTLSRQELSEHVVQYGVVPTIMIPTEALAHAYQRGCLYLYLLVVFVPIPIFRGAEWIRRRRADRDPLPSRPAADAPTKEEGD